MEGSRFFKSEEGLFRGYDEFYRRLKAGGLNPGQGFRAYNYSRSSGDEPRFCLGLSGKLYNQNKKEVDPRKVLSGENGWEFNGIGVFCLPDEIVARLP